MTIKENLPKSIGKQFAFENSQYEGLFHYYIDDKRPNRHHTTNELMPIAIWEYSVYDNGKTFDTLYASFATIEEANIYIDYLYLREHQTDKLVKGITVKSPTKEYFGERHRGIAESTARIMLKKKTLDSDYNWQILSYMNRSGWQPEKKFYLKGTLK